MFPFDHSALCAANSTAANPQSSPWSTITGRQFPSDWKKGRKPIRTVTLVPVSTEPGPLQRLVIRQRGQHPENDGYTGVQLDAHQAMRHGVTDVLKVHGGALDEASDGDRCAEGTRRCGGGGLFWCGRLRGGVRGEEVDEVGGRCAKEGGGVDGGLGLGASDQSRICQVWGHRTASAIMGRDAESREKGRTAESRTGAHNFPERS